jgi:predicted amino acid-binding ACT domain protein
MRQYDFTRLHGSNVIVSERIAKALGLVEGSQVYTSMFRYDRDGHSGYEVVASTFGPENYRQICKATFHMTDTPGSCAQVAKFLADRNVDILNSISISMIGNVTMVWNMLVDLSYFGEVAQLKEDFETLKKQKALSISNVDAMDIDISNMSDRYSKGIVAKGSNVKVKAIKQKQKTATRIKHGALTLSEEIMSNLEDVHDGALVMMVADTDSFVLSLSFLPSETKLAELEVCIPDKPGAIFEITNAMAKGNVNVLALYTRILVFYERMTIRIVVDVTKYEGGTFALVKDLTNKLTTMDGRYELISMKELRI